MRIFYTYLIGWRELDVWYYGYHRSADDDLWIKYFTSSDYVARFREVNGEPDVLRITRRFETRGEALSHENRFLRRVNAVRSPRWLNRHDSGDTWFYEGKPLKESHKEKISLSGKGKVWWNDGINETKSKDCPGEGWSRGRMTKRSSDEMRSIIKGKIWWNNGTEQTRAIECPEGWVAGRLPDTEASRESKRKMRLGKSHSPETLQKMREAWVRRKAA